MLGGVVIALMANQSLGGSVSVGHLRCEYLENPLAVDAAHPRFSWILKSDRRGAEQRGYRILVASRKELLDKNEPDLWDSGMRASGETYQIEYEGKPLDSRMDAFWKVCVRDETGTVSGWSEAAYFKMGLLHSEDWQAQWISNPTPAPPYVAANNGFHSGISNSAEDQKWVCMDLGTEKLVDSVALHPACPFDFSPKTEGFLFPVRFRIELSNDSEFRERELVVDKTAEDFPNPKDAPAKFSFEPRRCRFVRLVVMKLANRNADQFGFALAEMEAAGGGTVLSTGAKVTASDWIAGYGWGLQNLVDGDTKSHGASRLEALPAAYFKTGIELSNKPVRAFLYASAEGVYHATINGQRVGTNLLAPEWTDYVSRIQYQAYDVTKLLRLGPNEVDAVVGDGWFAGRIGMSQALHPQRLERGIYGRKTAFLAQLELEFADGTRQIVSTDAKWLSAVDGAIRSSDLYDGERFDARSTPKNWQSAITRNVSAQIVAQPNEPIEEALTVRPIAVSEPAPGVYVFDMGQNMVGVARLNVHEPSGKEITLRHAEMLNDDGTVYVANLRGAPQIDRFISDGRAAVYQPAFTYHGFRYVEVSGLSHKPKLTDLVGVVFHSHPEIVGSFECSNAMLNRLWQNILWTQRANMMSVPTDCPQRDERLGWMGDIMVFGETATLNMDMAAFYKKWIVDVRDAQADDGRYPDFAPQPYGKNDRFNGVPGWGDAGVIVPLVQYQTYEDKRMITEHLDSAKRWVEWIVSKNPDLIWRNDRHNDYGDWLNGDTLKVEGFPASGSECPKEVFATLVLIHSLDALSELCAAANDPDGASRYRSLVERARQRFRIEFTDAEGKMKGDTQAGYALAIAWNVLDEPTSKRAFGHLLDALRRCDNRASTGFHSTLPLLNALVQNGRADLAMDLVLSKRFPSWGFMIENGATTMWERWDGFVKGRGFQDPGMNSFNHWAFGAVGEFLMQRIAGIARKPGTTGWKEIVIEPLIVESKLDFAKGSYRSPKGTIAVEWTRKDRRADVTVIVPPGVRAEIVLECESPNEVKEGGLPAWKAAGVSMKGNRFFVASGKYHFAFDLRK